MIWLVVAFVAALTIAAATMVNRGDPFQAAARELGLKLSRTVPDLTPRLDGMIDGLATRIDIAAGHQPALRFRVFYPDLGISLRLDRETTISRTLGELGRADQQIGDARFDASFRVNTSRPDALRAMLTPELRRSLIDLIDRYPGVVVGDGEISLLSTNLEPPATDIVATTRDLVAVAAMLVANRPEPATAAAPPEPNPSVADAVRDRVADDTENAEPPPPEPPPAPTPPEEPPRAGSTGLPPGFFEKAFGTDRLSFEQQDTFDKEIKGTRVTLSGTVKQSSVAPAHYDEPEGQTKLVVTVATIESELYGATGIDAIVYLSDPAELERGATVTFTGTADRIDAFMRSLFVTDGQLI
jgi:hypothetical protein